MYTFRRVLAALLLVQQSLAVVPYTVQHALAGVPRGWSIASVPADLEPITLQIGLTQQNLDEMESKLYDLSTPSSPNYGKWMQRDEVAALVAPSAESNQAVLAWLKAEGVSQTLTHSDGDWVTFRTTVGNANRMFQASYKNYVSNGVTKLRTLSYSVPQTLDAHIDVMAPSTFLGKTTAAAPVLHFEPSKTAGQEMSKRQIAASCQTSITPACVRELYNVGKYVPNVKSGSTVGFGSFLNQSAIQADLHKFENFFGIPQQDFSVQLINGGTNNQNQRTAEFGEANLDVQNIIGLVHPLPVKEFITGGSPPFIPNLDEPTAADNSNEPYLIFVQYLLSQENSDLPQVISNSYGDDEQTVPLNYAKRVCNMFGQLGMRGITLFESSGDTGVGAPCTSNDGKNTPEFTPAFPGTCPYITAVGGTQAVPESAWVNGTGGFSNYFPMPDYQKNAVNTYLHDRIPKKSYNYQLPYFNPLGRGFPDISAHSLRPDYQVVYAGQLSPSGGTSAAAPVWAGIIGLLNDARMRKGMPSLGFLNPFLYSNGTAGLTDITFGGSVGCTGVNAQTGQPIPGGSVIPYASWNATAGWDAVTGLGVPNFQALLKIVT